MKKIGKNRLGQDIAIDCDVCSNRHILITGKSGAGKTTLMQKYVNQINTASDLIFIPDFTGEWKKRVSEYTNIINCRVDGITFPVFKRQRVGDDVESDYEIAKRIADVFGVVQKLGIVQCGMLRRAIQNTVKEDGISLDSILEYLQLQKGTSYQSLYFRVSEIIDSGIFNNNNDSRIKLDKINILDLSYLSMEIQNICMEFFLWWIFDYVVKKEENTSVMIVLDEFQRMNLKETSPLFRLLTEGRKYGVELLLATQTTSIFKKEQQHLLEQVGTRIYFQPSESEINMIKRQFPANIQNKVKERLSQLPVGHALAVGNFKVNGQRRMSNNPIEIII